MLKSCWSACSTDYFDMNVSLYIGWEINEVVTKQTPHSPMHSLSHHLFASLLGVYTQTISRISQSGHFEILICHVLNTMWVSGSTAFNAFRFYSDVVNDQFGCLNEVCAVNNGHDIKTTDENSIKWLLIRHVGYANLWKWTSFSHSSHNTAVLWEQAVRNRAA